MICPYCDEGFDFCDDEPKGEGVVEELECPLCEKNFVFHRSYSIDYWTTKADCLNGEQHNFEQVTRSPTVIGGKIQFRCIGCDKKENRQSKCPHEGPYCTECNE